jgi:peroxiredoxin
MEIPDFNELHEKYSSKGFEVLGVSISDTKDQLIKFLKAYKVDYPILYGDQTVMQKIISDYGGVYSIPMSFLLGKNNQIKRVYPGAILKQYDPNMYSDLIFNIESALSENNKENKSSDILDE